MIVTENQLDTWVRMNERDAQGVIVELLFRLVAATSPTPRHRRFPLGDSVGQHGADGELDVEFGSDPFVPTGHSFWEIGTGDAAQAKATKDYRELTAATPVDVRLTSTIVVVTPQSGKRGWGNTWTDKGQAKWRQARLKKQEWRDVRIVDGTVLVDWLRTYPAVGAWLAHRMGLMSIGGIETVEQRWDLTRSIGEPPPLHEDLFLGGREDARQKLDAVLDGTTRVLTLSTRYPDQVVDFVAAHIVALSPVNTNNNCALSPTRIAHSGRGLSPRGG